MPAHSVEIGSVLVSRHSTVIGAVCVGLVAVVVAGGTAGAAPIDDLRAKAKTIETQLSDNGAKVAALGEQINAAQLALDAAQAKIDDAETRTRAAKAETGRLETLVHDRVAALYRRGGVGPLETLDFSNAFEANARAKYGDVATRRDNTVLDQLTQARADLASQRHEAEAAHTAAQGERDAFAATKAQADAAAGAQQALLNQVNGQLGDLVRQEQARREAAAAVAGPKVATKNGRSWSGPVPNPSGGAGAAVAFARAQVGKPYEYAATGPDTFDCSGLTLRAWQAGGLSLPHYSGAQAAMFPHVPLDQLQPGDLITSSSWSAHIGIWVGDGYVHATHTGDFVRFVPGAGSVNDAVRPA